MLTTLIVVAAMAEPLHTVGMPDPAIDPRVDPIYFGSVEDGFPAAVGIGAGGFTLCSASLITPRLLLTAAHCSADLPVELVVAFGEAYFGTEAVAPDHAIGFVDAVTHPDYEPLANNGQFLGRFDLAVIVLAEDAPVDPVWPRLEPLDPASAIGDRIWSVGFGLDENGGSGVKRSARLTVDDIDDMFVISESSSNKNGANICSGDSGGPQYRELDDGTYEQWAVHSWGDIDCLFNSGSTRVDVAADWVLEQIEAVHGTTDRCAIEGRYGDGMCDEECIALDTDCVETVDPASFASVEPRGGCSTAPGTASWWALAAIAFARRRRYLLNPA